MWPLITQEYFDLTDQWPWEEDKFVKSLQTERGMPNVQSKVIKNPSSCLCKMILTLILYGLMTQQSFENIWIHVYLLHIVPPTKPITLIWHESVWLVHASTGSCRKSGCIFTKLGFLGIYGIPIRKSGMAFHNV